MGYNIYFMCTATKRGDTHTHVFRIFFSLRETQRFMLRNANLCSCVLSEIQFDFRMKNVVIRWKLDSG